MFVDHLADLAGGIESVQHRHLQIHQDHVKRLLGDPLHRLPTIADHTHYRIDAPQILDDELLIDPVVFRQQHSGTLQQGFEVLLIPLSLGLAQVEFVGAAVEQFVHLGQQGILGHRFGQKMGQPHAIHPGV